MKKKFLVVVVVVLAIAALAAGVVFASSPAREVSVEGKTVFLEGCDFGFIISNDKIQGLVDELKERGYDGCKFVSQVENGVSVTDSVTGVTFLTYRGNVNLEEGADIYDIDNVSVDFLIEGVMPGGNHPLVGMYETEFGEFDYFRL